MSKVHQSINMMRSKGHQQEAGNRTETALILLRPVELTPKTNKYRKVAEDKCKQV